MKIITNKFILIKQLNEISKLENDIILGHTVRDLCGFYWYKVKKALKDDAIKSPHKEYFLIYNQLRICSYI